MKKVIIASVVSLMFTPVMAQNTEIYGKLRVYQESYKSGVASSLYRQSTAPSWIGFRGAEDLGNGLKAGFVLETAVGVDSPTATTMGDRTSIVRLQNNTFSVAMGRDKHVLTRIYDRYDALGNTYGSSSGNIHAAQGTRFSNATFITFTPVKQVAINYNISASETAGVKNSQGASVDFTQGNFSTSVGRYDNGSTSFSNVLGARYALPSGTTLFTTYSGDTVTGTKTTGKMFGATQAVGPKVVAMVGYGETSTKKAYNAGVTYSLSVRTKINVRYVNEDDTVSSSDLKIAAIGLEHNF